MIISSDIKAVINSFFLSLLRLWLIYFANGALTPVILLSAGAIMISIININGGDFRFIQHPPLLPIFTWIGFSGNGYYDESDLLSFFAKITFYIFGIEIGIRLIYKLLRLPPINFKRPVYFTSYFLLTTLFGLSLVSTVLPSANPSAKSIIPVIIIFWVITMVSNLISQFLRKVANKINPSFAPSFTKPIVGVSKIDRD